MQGQTTYLEKVFAYHIFDKGLLSRIHKELFNVNNESTSQLKMDKRII